MSKGLEALEIVKAAMLSSGNCLLNSLWDYTDVIEKELKALEIIKKKSIDVFNVKFSYSVEEYNMCKGATSVALTQEEFDLLKEVLA